MKCPLCPTTLRIGVDGYVKCARFHRFSLEMNTDGQRTLVIAVEPKDSKGATIGDRYPVIDNEEKFQ